MYDVQERLQRVLVDIHAALAGVDGYLSAKEIRGLATLAAVPTTAGEVLEIGTFKGKSSIVLVKAGAIANPSGIVAVDPLPVPTAEMDRQHYGAKSAFDECMANLERAGVRDRVEFHRRYSGDLAKDWPSERRLRLLWIDGDHSYPGAKGDFDLFMPFVAAGGIIAMHDVLHEHGGPTRVFAEDILLSPRFGAFGFFGSVGWAQLAESADAVRPLWPAKLKAYQKLSRLVRHTAFGEQPARLAKLQFKLARGLIPHGDLAVETVLAAAGLAA